MGFGAFLSLPLPVVLALAALLLVVLMLAWVVAGLRRPVVVRVPQRADPDAACPQQG